MRRPEFVARQSACPSGILGRLIGRVMARETAAVNEAAVELLELRPTDHVLEVGFGHGATIVRVAAAVSGGFVAGVAVYFWPHLAPPLQEIARMLKPGGRLVLAHRTDPEAARTFPASVYRFPAEDEVRTALAEARLVPAPVSRRTFGPATVSFHVAQRRAI